VNKRRYARGAIDEARSEDALHVGNEGVKCGTNLKEEHGYYRGNAVAVY
jgi:hypothetical protein